MKLCGIFSAQWIPLTDRGGVDRAALTSHVNYQRHCGISGVLGLGSTGEFPRFSLEERKGILAALAEIAAPLPVIANISDIRPQAAIELGRFAVELGLPAVALMPPPFYPMSQADMLAFFLHVSDAVKLPVMLYNFPELAGKRIDLGTIEAFSERAPLIGVKQSGGEFGYHEGLVSLGRRRGFSVMSGADTRLPEAFGIGASGCIGGLVNIVPGWMVEIYRVCCEGKAGDISAAAAEVARVGEILGALDFPLNVAAGMQGAGFDPGARKSILSPESENRYRAIVEQVRALIERVGASRLPALEKLSLHPSQNR